MRKFVAAATLFALALPLVAVAQQEQGPPKVLVIYREDVKAGKNLAHAKNEAAWAQAVAHAKWPVHYLAMTTMSGSNQAWFSYGYDSLEAYEKDEAAQDKSAAMKAVESQYLPADGDSVAESRTLVLRQVSSLVTHPMAPGDLRYFRVRTTRVKLGHGPDYVQMVKLVNDAFEKAGKGGSAATYAVVAGAPAPTYITFWPAKSLSRFDENVNLREILGADYDQFMSLFDKSVAGYSDDYLQIDPKMSYPMEEWTKADPSFWSPKPVMAAKPKPASADKQGK